MSLELFYRTPSMTYTWDGPLSTGVKTTIVPIAPFAITSAWGSRGCLCVIMMAIAMQNRSLTGRRSVRFCSLSRMGFDSLEVSATQSQTDIVNSVCEARVRDQRRQPFQNRRRMRMRLRKEEDSRIVKSRPAWERSLKIRDSCRPHTTTWFPSSL
jgi:hypothetical protein